MRDWCFRPECLDRFIKHWPQAEVHRLDDCGHYVVEDAHERIVPLVRDFLDTHSMPSVSITSMTPQLSDRPMCHAGVPAGSDRAEGGQRASRGRLRRPDVHRFRRQRRGHRPGDGSGSDDRRRPRRPRRRRRDARASSPRIPTSAWPCSSRRWPPCRATSRCQQPALSSVS